MQSATCCAFDDVNQMLLMRNSVNVTGDCDQIDRSKLILAESCLRRYCTLAGFIERLRSSSRISETFRTRVKSHRKHGSRYRIRLAWACKFLHVDESASRDLRSSSANSVSITTSGRVDRYICQSVMVDRSESAIPKCLDEWVSKAEGRRYGRCVRSTPVRVDKTWFFKGTLLLQYASGPIISSIAIRVFNYRREALQWNCGMFPFYNNEHLRHCLT